jgi:AcrR family transcriptional regulator
MESLGGTPTDARGTHEAILRAARRRYDRFGPRKTTMAEVAREAGCSRATLYAHFGGKRALYAGLHEWEAGEFRRELAAVARSRESAVPRLRRVLEATLRIYAGNPVMRGALLGDDEMTLDRVAEPVVATHEKQVVELLRQLLDEGIAEGVFRQLDTQGVAYMMYQLGRVLVTREMSGQEEFPLDRMLRVMNDVMERGISRSGTRL